MTLAACLGLVLTAAFLTVMLRQLRPELAIAVTLAAAVVIITALLTVGLPILQQLQSWFDAISLPAAYGEALLKALGICLLTQLAADSCRDAGETALANKAELAGKLSLIVLALPLFQSLLGIVTGLINGQAVSP